MSDVSAPLQETLRELHSEFGTYDSHDDPFDTCKRHEVPVDLVHRVVTALGKAAEVVAAAEKVVESYGGDACEPPGVDPVHDLAAALTTTGSTEEAPR